MKISAKDLQRAVACVIDHGVLIYPTETVYGLGGDAASSRVVNRVRTLKGSDGDKPMLLLTDTWNRVLPFLDGITDTHRKLLSYADPLPVTVLFEAAPGAFTAIRGSSPYIGIRRTTYPFCCALIQRTDRLLCSTSANPAGQSPPTRFDHINPDLIDHVDLAVDATEELSGTPSTIIRINNKIEMIRVGSVSEAQINAIIEG